MSAKNQVSALDESAEKHAEPVVHKKSSFEEDYTQKTSRKIKENPMVPIGMAGFFVAAAYGIKHFRSRPPHVSASMYIMQFRVFAQSIAVGSMGVGIGYKVLMEKFGPRKEESHPKKIVSIN